MTLAYHIGTKFTYANLVANDLTHFSPFLWSMWFKQFILFSWHIAYFIFTFVGFPPYSSLFVVPCLYVLLVLVYYGCKAVDGEVDEYPCKSGDSLLIIFVVLDVFRICNCMIHWAMLNNEGGWSLQLVSCTFHLIQRYGRRPFQSTDVGLMVEQMSFIVHR